MSKKIQDALSCEFVIDIFIALMVSVYPLIFHDSYYDILPIKYQFYYISMIGMVILLVIMALFSRNVRSEIICKKGKFSLVDKAVLLFWICCVISTFQSDYFYESFWGNEGRYNGLFLMTLYTVMYLILSRFGRLKDWHIQLFFASGLVMCLIGITDYFQMDILHFRTPETMELGKTFASTIGNINTYTSYLALLMGLSVTLFALETRTLKMIWYYICIIITFMSITMAGSDNAYLALGVLFIMLPFWLFKSRSGILRYLIILSSYFTVILAISYINFQYQDMVLGLDSLFSIISKLPFLPHVVIALWGVTGVFWFFRARSSTVLFETSDKLARVWLICVCFLALLVGFMLADVNFFGNVKRYGVLGRYLLFNDEWGTYRGFIWRKALEVYQDFPAMHKLFGYGPDTFALLTTQGLGKEMRRTAGSYYDSVHNEYLHYLVTLGPIATLAYITFLFSSLKQMVRKGGSAIVSGILVAVTCYAIQATVNISVPMVAPAMWMFLSLGISEVRHKCEE